MHDDRWQCPSGDGDDSDPGDGNGEDSGDNGGSEEEEEQDGQDPPKCLSGQRHCEPVGRCLDDQPLMCQDICLMELGLVSECDNAW